MEEDQCDDKADDDPQNYLLPVSENYLLVHRFMITRVINRYWMPELYAGGGGVSLVGVA